MNIVMRKIGLELEYPAVFADGTGIDHKTIKLIWNDFVSAHPEWSLKEEKHGKAITGMYRNVDGYTEVINTDRGVCTVEFSLAPKETIQENEKNVARLLSQFTTVAEKRGVHLLTTGCQPITWLDRSKQTEKDWYILFNVVVPHWEHAVPMASHQAAIDVSIEEWPVVLKNSSALSGLIVALTTSAPLAQGKIAEWKSMRKWIWHQWNAKFSKNIQPYLSNDMPEQPYESVDDYLRFFWDSSLFFLTENKSDGYRMLNNESIIEYLKAKKPIPVVGMDGIETEIMPDKKMLNSLHQYGWPGEKMHYFFDDSSTIDGVVDAYNNNSLTEYLTTHSAGAYLEFRPSGVARKGEEMAVPALLLGLAENMNEATELENRLTWNEWIAIKDDAQEHGLDFAENKERNLKLIAEMLEIAEAGLQKRKLGEEKYLEPLKKNLKTGMTLADDIIASFTEGGMQRVLEEFTY